MEERFIFIDPGHGGIDPGARFSGVDEDDLNLAVGSLLNERLLAGGWPSEKIMMSRTTDSNVELTDRVFLAAARTQDIFISIHHNAAPSVNASGFEVWHWIGSHEGRILAEFVDTAMQNGVSLRNRGLRVSDSDPTTWQRRLFVLAKNACKASVLVECGFLSNDADRAFLVEPKNQLLIAQAIAEGVLEYAK